MKVFIYGPPGAGKTTLALFLGDLRGWPVYHLDAVFFEPGGAPKAEECGRTDLARITAGPHWIVEGNHGAAIDLAAARADRVVILRLGRWRSLWRITRRRFRTPSRLADKGPGGGPQILPMHLIRHTLIDHPRGEPSQIDRIEDVARGTVRAFDRSEDAAVWFS